MLELEFMRLALATGAIVGVLAPAVGFFLVQRQLSLIGDGIGHVAFAGVAAGWLVGIYPLISAAILAVLGALGIERMRSWRRDYGDLSLAIVFYSGIALGVVLTSLSRRLTVALLGYLFGSILTVTETDLLIIGAASAAVLIAVWLFGKEMFAVAYDEDIARVSGLPVTWLNYLIVFLAAITVVASLRVVGILLVAGMLVIPVAAALQIARSFTAALTLAVGFGITSVLAGLAAAYALDLAPGGAIVSTAILIFVISSLLREIMTRRRKRAAIAAP